MLIINHYGFNYDIFIHLQNVFVVVVWLRNALRRHWAFEHLVPRGSTIREGFRGVVMSAKDIMGGGLWELKPPPPFPVLLLALCLWYRMWTLSICLAPAAMPAAGCNASPPWQPPIPLNHSARQHFHLWVAWAMVFHHRDRKVTHAAFLWHSCTHPLPSFVVFMHWVWDWISLCSPIFCDWFTIYTLFESTIGTGETV